MQYTIQTERLGLRNWHEGDIIKMATINADPAVMEHFPKVQNLQETEGLVMRMQEQFAKTGYCYFAAERLKDKAFLGFIGLMYQDYEADFTPCIDIGWRLAQQHWGKGYATEGAKACLKFAFQELSLPQIYSVASKSNIPSINVMKKIGMQHQYDFEHPKLVDYPAIKNCVLYNINKDGE